MLRIAAAQINLTVGDLPGNARKILDCLKKARDESCDLVVFPELAVCGYPPEDLLHKKSFVRGNRKTLQQIARKTHGLTAVVGFVDTDAQGRLFNAAAVIRAGKVQTVHHKQELPNYGVFDEKRYFFSGKTKGLFRCQGVPLGVSICEDIWVDSCVCQKQAQAGCRLLINLSSSPYDMGKLEERERLLKKKARKTKTFICYVNLVGGQDELVFDGCSLVIDPRGRVIAHGKHFEEDFLVCDLPLGKARGVARAQTLASRGRLASQISVTERVYRALVLGTRDYLQKNGFQKALIGISGGIDSALVAAIAVDAIGSENVIGVSMPSRYSSRGTQTDAKRLARALGMALREIPIEGLYREYLRTLAPVFEGCRPDVTEENIQARIRGDLLMALSNKFGWLVLTTGNKSELAVGYCTLYGDMSGGFAVLKDVPKTLVYELAQWRNRAGPRVRIPASILKRAPSAELRPGQKDQDSLPGYAVLDALLKEYVEGHKSFAKMIKPKGRDADMVRKVIGLVDHSEYKRRQAPPGIKITPRAFGRDWRLPITNKYKEF